MARDRVSRSPVGKIAAVLPRGPPPPPPAGPAASGTTSCSRARSACLGLGAAWHRGRHARADSQWVKVPRPAGQLSTLRYPAKRRHAALGAPHRLKALHPRRQEHRRDLGRLEGSVADHSRRQADAAPCCTRSQRGRPAGSARRPVPRRGGHRAARPRHPRRARPGPGDARDPVADEGPKRLLGSKHQHNGGFSYPSTRNFGLGCDVCQLSRGLSRDTMDALRSARQDRHKPRATWRRLGPGSCRIPVPRW
jgi:hypothetical protein